MFTQLPSASLCLCLSFASISLPLFAHEGTHSGGNAMPALTNRVKITTSEKFREFEVNSLPDHAHGRFPNPGNPHKITPQPSRYRIPLNPVPLPKPRPVGMGAFGLALNGILFEPAAAEFWQNDRRSGWQYEALGHHLDLGADANHAHVQASGKYHYHGIPTGLVTQVNGDQGFALLGYAADGYPVYSNRSYENPHDSLSPLQPLRSSYRIKSGQRKDGPEGPYDGAYVQDYEFIAGLGDLDIANGHHGVTPEFPEGTYYYVITSTFPFIPRFWQGEPGPDFGRPVGANQAPGAGPSSGPRNRTRGAVSDAFPALTVLRDTAFTKTLNLSNAQSTGLAAAHRELEAWMRKNRANGSNPHPDDRRTQRLAMIAATEPRIKALRAEWLSASQNQLVDQKLNRALGADLLLQNEIREALQFSDTQFARIYQAIIDSRSSHSIELSWGEVGDLLDASQRQTLVRLVGALD
jgi:hypothetical protein